MVEDGDRDLAVNAGGADSKDRGVGEPSEKHLSKVDRVRKDFPETWLWSEMESGYLKILDVALFCTSTFVESPHFLCGICVVLYVTCGLS